MQDWAISRVKKNVKRWQHRAKVARKQRLPPKEGIKNYFQDYCENTTIHGFKYIGEKGRPKMERIWWILVLGLSVACNAYLINKVWRRWHDSPVILSFSETLTPVWQIPFPTVTICSETKARQRIFNFTKAMFTANLTEDDKKMRDDVSLICQRYLVTEGPKFTDESTIDIIKEVGPQLEQTIWSCKWKMEWMTCSELFTPVLTEEGICFSFNILNTTEIYRDVVVQSGSENDNMKTKSEWSLEKGYDMSAVLETIPHRGLGAGIQAGITVTLHTYEDDLDYLCRGPVQGFKILLHNPAEIPRPSERYFRVPLSRQLILSVKPNMMTTSEGLRSYEPSSRQCYFPSERHLAYFKVYTQTNCELECLTNYTLKKCQCVAFYMPRLESTQLCGAGSKNCSQEANDELYLEEVMLSIQKTQTREKTCGCLPACTSLQYDAEASQAYFKSHFEGLQLSRVSIFFKDVQFITSRRSELYSVADFLAICGGLLGLFSGISVLSLIEIVYYITLRFCSNTIGRRRPQRPMYLPQENLIMRKKLIRWAQTRHDTVTKKQKLLSKESIKKHFWDYCENTTIHGFKYISEKSHPRIERIWWIVVLGLSMVGSAYLIDKVWRKWHDSPVIVSFSEKLTPVWQIPFPAVTICSEMKVRQRVFNFTHAIYSTTLTEDEEKMMNDISLICDAELFINGSQFTDESTIDVLKHVAPRFEETLILCYWKGSIGPCTSLFKPVLTEEGICFSFNILDTTHMYRDAVIQSESANEDTKIKSEWSLENGYDASASLEAQPFRALGAGDQAGIIIILSTNEYDLDYYCQAPVQGFKIMLHNPAEVPKTSEQYFRVPLQQEMVLSVKPNMMTTSEGLRSYQPSSRLCYFPSERHLAYFKVYTQRNCELECLTNYTLKKCQCAGLHMPRLESTPLCGPGSKPCMYKAKDELSLEVIMLSTQKTEMLGNTCDCLPACTSLQYDAETSQAFYNWMKWLNAYKKNMSLFKGLKLSRVSIHFKDIQFITSIRNELYGVADFLALCGGLLGLFSGISVQSLIEVIYYITLRFYSNVRH